MSEAGFAEDEPSLPPLFRGEPAQSPLETAVRRAREGTDPGLVAFHASDDRLVAALVLAPEAPLEDAMAMILAAANGFADAFGALAPSEVACQFDWPGGIRINGARCGALRAAASTRDPAAEPGWLVIGLDVPLRGDPGAVEPGERPGETTLWEEGCGEISAIRLLESWSRHTLVWIHEWLDAGIGRLHRDWTGRAWGLGEEITLDIAGARLTGTFAGLDERGGLLLKGASGVRLVPLSATLEEV